MCELKRLCDHACFSQSMELATNCNMKSMEPTCFSQSFEKFRKQFPKLTLK